MIRKCSVQSERKTMFVVEQLFVVNCHSQTRHKNTHQDSGDGHQRFPTIFLELILQHYLLPNCYLSHLDESRPDESACDPDHAGDDGGDVGVGGHADVAEHVDGVKDDGIASGELLEDEHKQED